MKFKFTSDFKPMSKEEINNLRMKAYLSFDEEEEKLDSSEKYYYKNKLGNLVSCVIILKRDNGEIVVENEKGCRVCLREKDLIGQNYNNDL